MTLITLYLVNDAYIISLPGPGYEPRPYSFVPSSTAQNLTASAILHH